MEEELKEEKTIKNIEERKSKLKNFFFRWIKDNYDKTFLIVLILAFIIRFWIFFETMNQPLWWDEADYLAAAKRLGLGLNFKDIWYYRRGFLFPIIGSLFFKLNFGEIGVRFLEVLFSVGVVIVSYILISKMFDKKSALFASIGISLSWVFLFFTGRVLTDIPSAFFILLALLFFWKGYILKEGDKFLYLFPVFFVLSILTRMQSFMFAPAFLICIFVKEKFKMFKNKKLWIVLSIFILLLIPQFILYGKHYGNPFADLAAHYLGIGTQSYEVVEGNNRGFSWAIFNYFIDLPYIMSNSIFILLIFGTLYFFGDLIIGFDKLFKNELLQKKFFVLCWIFSLFLIMGFIGQVSYVEQRYISAGLPFLFMIAGSSLIFLEKILINNFKYSKKIISFLMIILFLLLLIPNFILSKNMIENKIESYSEIREAGLWIKENSNISDIIFTSSRPQIVYYAERTVQGSEAAFFSNKSYLEEKIKELKPKYLMLSAYEYASDEVYNLPNEKPDQFIPVKIYYNSQNPIVIIYEIKYS